MSIKPDMHVAGDRISDGKTDRTSVRAARQRGPPRRDPGSPGGIPGPGRGRSAPLSHRVSWLHLGTGWRLGQLIVFTQREVSRFMTSRGSPLGAGTRAERRGCLRFKDKTAFWVPKPTRGLFSFDRGLDASQRDGEPILNGRFPKEMLSGQGREVPSLLAVEMVP